MRVRCLGPGVRPARGLRGGLRGPELRGRGMLARRGVEDNALNLVTTASGLRPGVHMQTVLSCSIASLLHVASASVCGRAHACSWHACEFVHACYSGKPRMTLAQSYLQGRVSAAVSRAFCKRPRTWGYRRATDARWYGGQMPPTTPHYSLPASIPNALGLS